MLKNSHDLKQKMAEAYGFKYNLTLFGTPGYADLNATLSPEEQSIYHSLHPIQTFNSLEHSKIILIVKHILIPVIEDLMSVLENSNQSHKDSFTKVIKIIIYCYLCLVVSFYFLVWRAIEKNVGQTIVKAKNMLNIIPKEILVNLQSVYSLFRINVNSSSSDSENEDENSKMNHN